MNLSWKDPRIQFHNLKNQEYQNSLLESEKQMIWIPKVTFLNTAKQVNTDLESMLNDVISGSKPKGQHILDNCAKGRTVPDQ